MTKKQIIELLSDGNGNWTDRSVEDCVNELHDSVNTYAINDIVLGGEMVDDLMDNYNYSELEAKEWVEEFGSDVISDMWDAYSSKMEEDAVYKDDEDESDTV